MNYFLFVMILLSCLSGSFAEASAGNDAFSETERLENEIDEIIRYECKLHGVGDEKELIAFCADNPDNSRLQSFVIALYGYHPQGEYQVYADAIQQSLTDDKEEEPAVYIKKKLILYALGKKLNGMDERTINTVFGSDILQRGDEQGIMSEICLLQYLCSTGVMHKYEEENVGNELAEAYSTGQRMVAALNDRVLPDGGFALTGNQGDADVTAMAVQALAGVSSDEVKQMIADALVFLTTCQTEDGDIIGFGNSSSESTAQVMIALETLGVDSNTNFVQKDESGRTVTLYDGIIKYHREDGGYSHVMDTPSNEMATIQVLTALVARYRIVQGLCPLYSYFEYTEEEKNAELDLIQVPLKITKMRFSLQLTLILLVLIGGILYLLLPLIKKRRLSAGKIISSLLICGVLISLIVVTDIKLPEDFYAKQTEKNDETISITMSVSCKPLTEPSVLSDSDTVGQADNITFEPGVAETAEMIPSDGWLIPEENVSVSKGATALDGLIQVTAIQRVQLDYSGPDSAAYVRGIGYLYERDYGELSGWMYRINGEFMSLGCGEYELQEGDTVEWIYSCNMGKDIE